MTQTPSPDVPPYPPTEASYGEPQAPYGTGQSPYGANGLGQPLSPAALPWRAGTDDNTWALLAHVGAIFFSFVAPLIVLLTKGKESGYVRDQSVEALNWTITLAIGWVAVGILAAITLGLGFVLYPVIAIVALVFGIIATLAASRGETYRYPWALRLVK